MTNKKDIFELDFYDILHLSIEATDKEIKKSYRKVALKCHPDKNPDNPKAAAEFDQLQKIFDILSNPVEKSKYDQVLKGRKLAAIRARERSAHSQKLKSDLDRREKEAAEARNQLSGSQKLAREVERLKEEGDRLVREDIARLENEKRKERKRDASRLEGDDSISSSAPTPQTTGSNRVKVKWVVSGEEGYTKEKLHEIFYKWGELNGIALKTKGMKGTALVDYKEKMGADMAVMCEKGLEGCPLTITHLETKQASAPSVAPTHSSHNSNGDSNGDDLYRSQSDTKDYESLANRQKRQQNERARLIAEMRRTDGVEEED